jgi:hypothetical protein
MRFARNASARSACLLAAGGFLSGGITGSSLMIRRGYTDSRGLGKFPIGGAIRDPW